MTPVVKGIELTCAAMGLAPNEAARTEWEPPQGA